MNLKSLKAFIGVGIMLLSIVAIQSCNNDGDNTARVQLKLVDEPGDYLEVNVEIVDIQYNTSDSEEGWMSFIPENGYPINVDLTELVAGNDLLLVDQIIPSGMLKQIRLVLGENNTLVMERENGEGGEPIPLDTPSALQSGLKLNLNEELQGGFSYTFILDWVVSESVVEAGNSGMYNLKPVIRVNAQVNSGSISGTVLETIEESLVAKENVTVEVYKLDDTKVTDTMTDDLGNFLIQGLEAGSYKLKIAVEGYQGYESENIGVTVGQVLDVGTVELLPL
ncbi:DUF4382 domain-containing protein [Seonamhaeicola aphaedonensis]|uniref:Carboxypeptidase family protein n=1 Tax=Seonamhaeicola aphaedonensis TaxID=1461338 RepID=A0A3D9HH05_9FLAO|nr:DUF4382 domain-containing protein [Seonamhaeicola aphaedonensis]RED48789.1 carboxypeptidase family protein [Seonamhaeicola aphaedonensis]